MPDPKNVNSMFARIARRYDVANRLLSFGRDVSWRKRLVRAVSECRPRRILDLATGSGDVAFSLADGLGPGIDIVGMDFCKPMLDEAEKKKVMSQKSEYRSIRFVEGDGMAIALPDNGVDVVTISFGLRNMADRNICLKEIRRVLKPSGTLFILEFSQPHPWFRPFYLFYLRHVLPRLAGLITGDKEAYQYLNESIEAFPGRPQLCEECKKAGFVTVNAVPLTMGIVALHKATK
jgi:demethylmenaquinone methyltransferase / 2-methoxy-6-polyprenyl-1,4-benzoquinol methylase